MRNKTFKFEQLPKPELHPMKRRVRIGNANTGLAYWDDTLVMITEYYSGDRREVFIVASGEYASCNDDTLVYPVILMQ